MTETEDTNTEKAKIADVKDYTEVFEEALDKTTQTLIDTD